MPPPRFFFSSKGHRRAMAYLVYGAHQGEGFIVINHDLEDQDLDNRFHSALSEASVKFSYTFRF